MNSNFTFSEVLKKRTKSFAINVIGFTKSLDKSLENIVFIKQMIRSSTSVAANYRASCRARSEAEFYSKLSIVLEEADETLFWLEMIEECNVKSKELITPLQIEAEELMKIFAKSRKTLSDKRNESKTKTIIN